MKRYVFGFGAAVLACLVIGSWNSSVKAENSLSAPENEIVIDGKKPAHFSHPVHLKLGLECGVCHHDKGHKPLNQEAISGLGDPAVLSCVSCHNTSHPVQDLRKAKDVFHARCKTCHKTGYEGKNGPTKCSGCHIKKKKALEGC